MCLREVFYNAGVLYYYYLLASARECSCLLIKFDDIVTVISWEVNNILVVIFYLNFDLVVVVKHL